MSATSKSSKSPLVSPFRSFCNVCDGNIGGQYSKAHYLCTTRPHPCKYTLPTTFRVNTETDKLPCLDSTEGKSTVEFIGNESKERAVTGNN